MKSTALLCCSLTPSLFLLLLAMDIVACVFVTEQYVLYYSRNFGIASNVAWEPFMRNGNAPTNTPPSPPSHIPRMQLPSTRRRRLHRNKHSWRQFLLPYKCLKGDFVVSRFMPVHFWSRTFTSLLSKHSVAPWISLLLCKELMWALKLPKFLLD